MAHHLDDDQIARVLDHDGWWEEIHGFLIHLSMCPKCRRRLVANHPAEGPAFLRREFPNLARDVEGGPPRVWEAAWAGTFSALPWAGSERPSEVWARENPEAREEVVRLALRLNRERYEAKELLAELVPLAPAQRRLKVRNTERCKTLGMVRVLLERARESWISEPDEAEALADLALEIHGELEPRVYDVMVLEDFRARGLAYLGNARRVRSDLAGAEEALDAARKALDQGTGDVLERATVAWLESSLRREQRRYDEAMDCATEAAELYRSVGDRSQEAWMWIAQALIAGDAGRAQEAIGMLRDFLRRSTRLEVGDRVYLYAVHGLSYRLAEAGRWEEARCYLPEIRRLAAVVSEPLVSVRVVWLEGLIHAGLGEVEDAVRCYRSVLDAFIADGIGHDAALVSLDLALLYLREGRVAEARELAAEMLPIFRSRGIHREALGALRILQEALAREVATEALGREVAEHLPRLHRFV